MTATSRIETDRLELVPLTREDAAEMVGVLADVSLYAVIGGAPPTLDELEDRYARWADGSPRPGEEWHNWVVRLRDGGAAIGHVQATVTDGGREADVAWLIGPPWQGRGYAGEAARAMIAWLDASRVATITAHIEAGHEASARVARAAGLSPTEDLEDGEVVWRRTTRRVVGELGEACHTWRMSDQASCGCGCPNTFNAKSAEGDLKRYHEKGPDRTTTALIDAIVAEGIEGATLLDIGGGIGAIPLQLLARGVATATSVDASEAYVQVANAEATRRGLGDRIRPLTGTFETLATGIEPVDIVTLDRVVCCDPDLPGLVGRAAERARRMVGLVYPRETWWNRIAARVINSWAWLTRDATRWHLHRPAEIDALLRRAGFSPREVDRTLVWQVVLYVRQGTRT